MHSLHNNHSSAPHSSLALRLWAFAKRAGQWAGGVASAAGRICFALLKALPRATGGLRRWLLTLGIVAIAAVLGLLVYGLWNTLNVSYTVPEVTLQPTVATLEEVRPRGELYVCTAVVEDYVTRQETETHMMLFPERHSCVQILKQKVSFRIDLDKVRYTLDTLNQVRVELPEPEYVASTQESPFLSDDEDYWREQLPSTNGLKREVEKKIRRRFDTETNRRKARRYAEEAVGDLLWRMGYETRFVSPLEKKKD